MQALPLRFEVEWIEECCTAHLGGTLSACRNTRMSPVAAAAPAFICRARPLPALTTLAPAPVASSAVLPWPQPQRISAKLSAPRHAR